MASIKITGLEAVQRAFKELEPKVARKVIRQAQRNAIGIPKAVAAHNTPVLTGAMKKSIRIRSSKGPRGSKGAISIALLIGAAAGAKSKKGQTLPWWAFLIEHGWTIGKRLRSGGKVVGRHKLAGGNKRIPGKHIMKNALRQTEGQVKTQLTTEILAGIDREANK